MERHQRFPFFKKVQKNRQNFPFFEMLTFSGFHLLLSIALYTFLPDHGAYLTIFPELLTFKLISSCYCL